MDARWWTVLACLLLSGCTGPVEKAASEGGSRVTGTVVDGDEPPAAAATVGHVKGIVINDAGLPIAGALVLVISIDHSVETDKNGSFAFAEVAAGRQTLRVERENYQTLVQGITVVAGKQLKLEVVMVPHEGLNPGFLDHFHDHWRGSDRYTVFDATLEWDDEIDQEMEVCSNYVGGEFYDRACNYLDMIPDEGRIIPPGTKELEITVQYTAPAGQQPTMYFDPPDTACPPGQYCYNVKYWPMEAGATYTLPMEPLWTDHGHAINTGWLFYIYWYDGVGVDGVTTLPWPVAGSAWNSLMKSPVEVKIEAIKGELAIDPPHPRFWQDNATMALTDAGTTMACLGCTSFPRAPTIQNRYDCNAHCILFNAGDVVPPGATRLEFIFDVTWFGRDEAFDATYDMWSSRHMLGYKSPDVGLRHGTWDDYVWPDPVEVFDAPYGQRERYIIDLTSDDTDVWYDTYSQWMFTIAPEGEPDAETNEAFCPVFLACPYPYFRLMEVRVHNDEVEAQREAGLI